jgi:hypothetical protein
VKVGLLPRIAASGVAVLIILSLAQPANAHPTRSFRACTVIYRGPASHAGRPSTTGTRCGSGRRSFPHTPGVPLAFFDGIRIRQTGSGSER